MPRYGRPKIEPASRRGGFLSFRLTAGERAAIDQAAALAGKSATKWARETVLAAASESERRAPTKPKGYGGPPPALKRRNDELAAQLARLESPQFRKAGKL